MSVVTSSVAVNLASSECRNYSSTIQISSDDDYDEKKKNDINDNNNNNNNKRFMKMTILSATMAIVFFVGIIGKRERQSIMNNKKLGDGPRVPFLGDNLPFCGKFVDDDLRTKLLHNGEEVQDAAVGYKECQFFDDLAVKAKYLASQPSSCVASNTIHLTYTSGDDFYHNIALVVHNLKNQQCFMERFLIVCADSDCSKRATDDGFNNIEYPADSSNSDTAYGRFTWMKQKISLGVIGAGVNMFMFDADVVLFETPDTNSFLSQSNVDGMFQEDYMDYHDAYANGVAWTKNYLNEVHSSSSNFNSGQMWYKASERTSRWLQTSLAHGVICTAGGGCGLEQNILHDAAIQAPQGDTELGTAPFSITIKPLPIQYATFCSRTTDPLQDWDVIKHMGEWKTLHMCCSGWKYDGMANAIYKRKCAMETPSPACVDAAMPAEERWDYNPSTMQTSMLIPINDNSNP